MKKDKLYTAKRYLIVFILAFLLIFLGASLEKAWHITPETHFNLALPLLKGKQPYKAIPHLVIASKSQDPVVQMLSAYQLARLYSKGADGISKNMEKAIFYYEKAASMKMPEAQYELALLYDVGDKIPENRSNAIKWMLEAAYILPEAKYALAVWIERGYLGAPNQAWAVSLYEQAAETGIQNAMKSLISIYYGGYGLFPQNIKKEQYWRRRLEESTQNDL